MSSYFSSHRLLDIYYALGRHYAKCPHTHTYYHTYYSYTIISIFTISSGVGSGIPIFEVHKLQLRKVREYAQAYLGSQQYNQGSDIDQAVFESPVLGLQPGLLTVTVLWRGLNEGMQCHTQSLAPSTEQLHLMFPLFSMTPGHW